MSRSARSRSSVEAIDPLQDHLNRIKNAYPIQGQIKKYSINLKTLVEMSGISNSDVELAEQKFKTLSEANENLLEKFKKDLESLVQWKNDHTNLNQLMDPLKKVLIQKLLKLANHSFEVLQAKKEKSILPVDVPKEFEKRFGELFRFVIYRKHSMTLEEQYNTPSNLTAGNISFLEKLGSEEEVKKLIITTNIVSQMLNNFLKYANADEKKYLRDLIEEANIELNKFYIESNQHVEIFKKEIQNSANEKSSVSIFKLNIDHEPHFEFGEIFVKKIVAIDENSANIISSPINDDYFYEFLDHLNLQIKKMDQVYNDAVVDINNKSYEKFKAIITEIQSKASNQLMNEVDVAAALENAKIFTEYYSKFTTFCGEKPDRYNKQHLEKLKSLNETLKDAILKVKKHEYENSVREKKTKVIKLAQEIAVCIRDMPALNFNLNLETVLEENNTAAIESEISRINTDLDSSKQGLSTLDELVKKIQPLFSDQALREDKEIQEIKLKFPNIEDVSEVQSQNNQQRNKQLALLEKIKKIIEVKLKINSVKIELTTLKSTFDTATPEFREIKEDRTNWYEEKQIRQDKDKFLISYLNKMSQAIEKFNTLKNISLDGIPELDENSQWLQQRIAALNDEKIEIQRLVSSLEQQVQRSNSDLQTLELEKSSVQKEEESFNPHALAVIGFILKIITDPNHKKIWESQTSRLNLIKSSTSMLPFSDDMKQSGKPFEAVGYPKRILEIFKKILAFRSEIIALNSKSTSHLDKNNKEEMRLIKANALLNDIKGIISQSLDEHEKELKGDVNKIKKLRSVYLGIEKLMLTPKKPSETLKIHKNDTDLENVIELGKDHLSDHLLEKKNREQAKQEAKKKKTNQEQRIQDIGPAAAVSQQRKLSR